MKVKFTKRKRGLLKKAMEMASQCKKKVFLLIHDEESNHLVTYNSSPVDFCLDQIATMMNDKKAPICEKYDDSFYKLIVDQPYLKQSALPREPEKKAVSIKEESECSEEENLPIPYKHEEPCKKDLNINHQSPSKPYF